MSDIDDQEGDKEDSVFEGEEVPFEDHLSEELEDMLKKAISEENFEEASKLRDEINRRKDLD